MKILFQHILLIAAALILTITFTSHPSARPEMKGPEQKDVIHPKAKNLLTNPGFEDGRTGWVYPDWSKAWATGGFDISGAVARTGKYSAWLHFDVPSEAKGTVIRGVMQELKPGKFPQVISGYYKVDRWQRGAEKQYLQFVVIVWQEKYNFPNHQIRYILGGVDKQPYNMRNARYIFINGPNVEPKVSEWVRFEANVLNDFQTKWNETPQGYDKVQFFFEARYDSKSKGSPKVLMDVYFDDLFVGDVE